jgi:hypothetical protein
LGEFSPIGRLFTLGSFFYCRGSPNTLDSFFHGKSKLYNWINMNELDHILTDASGTDVMIFKIFSPKNSAKKLAFLTQSKAKLCKIVIITLIFEKNANFSPKIVKNRRKL